MTNYGLIGYPLGHSFSKKYFTEKFEKEGISDSYYDLYPLQNIGDLPQIIAEKPTLKGLNVTIPHKETILTLLDELDPTAATIGAVNCVKIKKGKLIGYNTDAFGFEQSLKKWLNSENADLTTLHALILGDGGAAKAVAYALQQLQIPFKIVSRHTKVNQLNYEDLFEANFSKNIPPLIINTTPLGMSPNNQTYPNIPYKSLTQKHFAYDLVYNPLETMFMQKAKANGSLVKNGLEMLHLQAEKAWQIWEQA
jgi:shikimate dehydrogenase